MTGRFLTFLALFALFGLGCAHPAGHAEVSQTAHADRDAVFLDATAKWTDSPFILANGEAVDISAIGWVRDRLPTNAAETAALWSDPAGTYLVSAAHDGSSDPLPSGSPGPAPAMALPEFAPAALAAFNSVSTTQLPTTTPDIFLSMSTG